MLRFLSRPDAARMARIGPATPDHLLHTRRFPLFIEETSSEGIAAPLQQYVASCTAAFPR